MPRTDLPSMTPVTARPPLAVRAYTLTNALGAGRAATLAGLLGQRTGLRPCDVPLVDFPCWIGRVADVETQPLPAALNRFESRNHRLAGWALQQDDFRAAVAAAARRHGPDRVGVIIGTSTSGIRETEVAYRQRDPVSGRLPADFRYRETQNTFAPADFIRTALGVCGPTLSLSTACSSSAKVFASAARWLNAGWCDAVVAGGVDSLCLTTLYGFKALELVSESPCRPADADRDGISIGEAAGFALLERASTAESGLALLGYGESADAHHMSSPHPDGRGAVLAMRQCLERAGRPAAAVDFTLLHGTATRSNDSAEDRALCEVLGAGTPCSSIKGWIGHTLGAAGIMNLLIGAICLEEGLMPPSLNTRRIDPAFGSRVLLQEERRALQTVLCNAFGFGGSNASLLLGRTAA